MLALVTAEPLGPLRLVTPRDLLRPLLQLGHPRHLAAHSPARERCRAARIGKSLEKGGAARGSTSELIALLTYGAFTEIDAGESPP